MSVRFTSNSSAADLIGSGPAGTGALGLWVLPLAFTGTFGVFSFVNGRHYVGVHPNQIFIYTTSESLGSVIPAGTWQYIGFNWNETLGVIEAFLNGVSDVSQLDFSPLVTPGINFGTGGGAFYFDGALRGARVWSGVTLTGPQFAAEALSTTPVHTANLFDQWDFANQPTAAASRSGSHNLSVANLSTGPSDPPPYRMGGMFLGVVP